MWKTASELVQAQTFGLTGRTRGVKTAFTRSTIKRRRSQASPRRQELLGRSPETGRGRKIRQTGTGTLWQEGHNRKSGRVLPQGYKAGKPGRIMTD